MKERLIIRKIFSKATQAILSLLVIAMICTRCIKVPSDEITITLAVSTNALNYASSGGGQTFTITSNDRWTVSREDTWLTVSSSSGSNNETISVTADANTTTASRTAHITVRSKVSGIAEHTITATQVALNPTLTVSTNSLSFVAAGEGKSFTITSNTSWTIASSESWLTVAPTSGANGGTVSATAAPNTSTSQRTATITVRSGVSGVEQKINVIQSSSIIPKLSVTPATLSFNVAGEQKILTISSNINWTVNVAGSDTWLTITPTSGSGDGTVTVTATANTTARRTASITFSGGDLTQTVEVTQEATPAFTVSHNSLTFSAYGEQKTFAITSNTSWTVSSDNPSWCTVAPASGTNNGSVTVTAISNTITNQRTASITVNGGGFMQTIHVTQMGKYEQEPDMIFIQGGTFIMGCTSGQGNDCYSNEKPPHQVTVRDYYIGKYEVTQAQWRAVMGNNPSNFKGDNYPVEMVNWNDVQEYIKKLNAQTGKQYRLPTEAEWEFAARGGTKGHDYLYSGSLTADLVAWSYSNSNRSTHAVNSLRANELGIYHMSGNVSEWCNDWYSGYSDRAQIDPTGPSSGSQHVVRGGSWLDQTLSVRVTVRSNESSDSRLSTLGFRLACNNP